MPRISALERARATHLGDVFTRREAETAGISPAHLRSRSVHPVFRGVFTTAEYPTRLDIRTRAALKLAGPRALVCETTALALWGVELPDARLADTVHLWLPAGASRPRLAGIRVHQNALTGPPTHITGPLYGASPPDCWLQAAQHLTVHDLVVLADGLTRRRDPMIFADDLRTIVTTSTGRRGIQAARRALDQMREGTDSPTETRLRLLLVDAGLPCPAVNHPLTRADGSILFYLDMAYVEARVAVEYDGALHVGDTVRMQRDQSRRRRIEDLGWRLLTATAADLAAPADFLASVRTALTRTPTRPHH